MRLEPPAWQQQAACLGLNPELFFPEQGDPTTQAKAVCARCPVRADCLAYAIQHNIDHGIWGGLTEKHRRGLNGPRPSAEHGTRSRYTTGCRCGPCRTANTEYNRQWYARRPRLLAVEQPTHRNSNGTFARKPADTA